MYNIFGRSNRVKGKRNEDLPLPHDGLPDSYRPSGLCPRCGKQSSFEILGSLPVTFSGGMIYESGNKSGTPAYVDQVTSMKCRHCNQCVVVIEEEWTGDQPSRNGYTHGGVNSHRGIHWWPLPESNLSKDIPDEISNIYSEASATYYANAPRATVAMLRRTLEAICVHFGEDKGHLNQRLQDLASKNILQPALSEWAKEVRLIGNQGAHYDPANLVSMEDARQLLDFTRELMKYLFELPAELKRRRGF